MKSTNVNWGQSRDFNKNCGTGFHILSYEYYKYKKKKQIIAIFRSTEFSYTAFPITTYLYYEKHKCT